MSGLPLSDDAARRVLFCTCAAMYLRRAPLDRAALDSLAEGFDSLAEELSEEALANGLAQVERRRR